MELKIYNQSGALKLIVSTSSSSTWNQELMREDAVSASFTHPFYVPLDVNDYVMLEGVKFSIKKEYKPKQKNMQTYSYNVKFYAPIHDAEQVMYLNLTDGQYDVQFSLDGSPREHLKKWVDNMNRIYGREVWSMGDVVVSANQTIEYNNLTCWDALTSIAEAFETEWWADGFTMNLSRCERGERVELGYLKGLTSLTQSENSDDVKFFTRLIPLGSTKNIDRSRYGYTRLQLPDKSTYVDRNTQYGLYEYVEEAAFAEIFPHYTGTVSEVRAEEKTGDDKKPFTVYYFKDSGMAFDPCENEIGGLVKHVSFQTGDLAGRDFEANYNSETKEWEIINIYPDEEIQIPGGNLIPRVGDTYIPWNFRMPTEYEVQAELDYKAAVDDFLKKYSDDIAIYGGETDYIHIDKNSVPLVVGQNVRLLSAEYFGEVGYRDSRMTKVVRKLDNLSIATIQCTNQVGKGWKSQVDSSLAGLKYVVAKQQEEAVLDILRSWDTREVTDYRLMSALRIIKEISKRAISRISPDTAQELITFLKGIKTFDSIDLGNFVTGMLGGTGASVYFDRNQKTVLEIDKILAREELIVPQITFNTIDVVTGEKAQTFCYGTIKSVDTKNKIAEVELLEGQYGTCHSNDICRGVFHRLEDGNRSDDNYDINGFMNYSGFSTSYFTPTEILVNDAGRMSFSYELQPNTSTHPTPGMNFYGYGNFTDKNRQSITYETRDYTRRLKDMNTWIIDPSRNIAMQNGLLDGLTIGGMEMHGYGTFNENNYLTGVTIQFTPQQMEELKGEDAYSVVLSTYESAVVVNVDGDIVGNIVQEYVSNSNARIVNDGKYVVTKNYRLRTHIQVHKGSEALFFSHGFKEGAYMVALSPKGCEAMVENGVVYITKVTDTSGCSVGITVNCEGNAAFEKTFNITVVNEGVSPVIADIDNEMSSVACDATGKVVAGLPLKTGVSIFYGIEQLSLDKVELSVPAGVTASQKDGIVTVSGITAEAADTLKVGITLYATKGGVQYTRTLTYTINKVRPGTDGKTPLIVELLPSDNSVKKSSSSVIPSQINCKLLVRDGDMVKETSILPEGYRMSYSLDAAADKTYACGTSLSTSGLSKNVKFSLYKENILADVETIPVVIDGIDGKDGMDGIPGVPGKDGKVYYTWLKYADDAKGSGMSNSPDGKSYMGLAYNKETQVESNTPSDYTWSRFRGEDGTDGVPGAPGADGKTYYTWIAYSDYSDGRNMYQIPNDNTKYIGIAVNKPTAVESNTPSDYTWSKFRGTDGTNGKPGVDGSTNVELFRVYAGTPDLPSGTLVPMNDSASDYYHGFLNYWSYAVPENIMVSQEKVSGNKTAAISGYQYTIDNSNLGGTVSFRLRFTTKTANQVVNIPWVHSRSYSSTAIINVDGTERVRSTVSESKTLALTLAAAGAHNILVTFTNSGTNGGDYFHLTFANPDFFELPVWRTSLYCIKETDGKNIYYVKAVNGTSWAAPVKYKDAATSYHLKSDISVIGVNSLGSLEPSAFTVRQMKNLNGVEKMSGSYFMTAFYSTDGTNHSVIRGYESSRISSLNVNIASVASSKSVSILLTDKAVTAYPSTYIDRTVIQVVRDGNSLAATSFPRLRGDFDANTRYYYNSQFRDVVRFQVSGIVRIYRIKNYSEAGISGISPSNTAYWEEASIESFRAIDTALIDGADIAGFKYKNLKMITPVGTINGVKKNFANLTANEAKIFEPYLYMNGNTGEFGGAMRTPYIPFTSSADMVASWNWSWFIYNYSTYYAVNGVLFGTRYKYNGLKLRIVNTYMSDLYFYIPFLGKGHDPNTANVAKIIVAKSTRFEGEFIPNPKSFSTPNQETDDDGTTITTPYAVCLFPVTILTDKGMTSDSKYPSIRTFSTI